MWHVLLLILKILLIIIAVVLGIVLLALLAVLFVPIRYRISGQYNDDKQCAYVKCSWLLHIISLKAGFDKGTGFAFAIRLFGIKLNRKKDTDKDSNSSIGGKKKKESRKADERSVFDEEDTDDADAAGCADAGSFTDKQDPEQKNSQTCDEQENEIVQNLSEEPKKSIVQKLKDAFGSVKAKISGIKNKIIDLKNNTRQKVDKIIETVNNEHYRELAKFLLRQLKAVFRAIKPRKGHLAVRYGFDDVETTGKVTMYLAILYGIIGVDVTILPDFNEKVLEGDVMLKGHIRLISLAVIAVRCFMNRDFRKYILKR